MRRARVARLDLANSTNLYKYLISFMSVDNRRRNTIRVDYLSQSEETISAKVEEFTLQEILPSRNPTLEELKETLNMCINKTSTNLTGLERNLVEAFQEKRDVENKLKENANPESSQQSLNIFISNMLEVIDHILSKKESGKEMLETYEKYEDLVNKSTTTSMDLELGRIGKEEAIKTCKDALDIQADLIIKINEFYLDNLNSDEELLMAQAALIGNPRNLRDNFRHNIEELRRNNAAVFNTSSDVEVKVSNIPHLQEKENSIIEGLRECRNFVDEEQNQRALLSKEKRLLVNMIADLLTDVNHLENDDIDLSNIDVMKSSIESLEKQLISVSKINPEVSKEREEVVYYIDGVETKENHVIGNVVKKIRYEVLKKRKNIEGS